MVDTLQAYGSGEGAAPAAKATTEAPKKFTLVITKKEKKEEPADAGGGGWQAVLAEMQRKKDAKNGISAQLKKVEVKAAPVRHLSSQKL